MKIIKKTYLQEDELLTTNEIDFLELNPTGTFQANNGLFYPSISLRVVTDYYYGGIRREFIVQKMDTKTEYIFEVMGDNVSDYLYKLAEQNMTFAEWGA